MKIGRKGVIMFRQQIVHIKKLFFYTKNENNGSRNCKHFRYLKIGSCHSKKALECKERKHFELADEMPIDVCKLFQADIRDDLQILKFLLFVLYAD